MNRPYNTMEFHNIFTSAEDFLQTYKDSGFPMIVTEDSIKLTYRLLLATYYSNPIVNSTVEAFKLKVCANIFKFAPAWEKRLEIQDKVRKLSDEQLQRGADTISNIANNPNEEPSTASLKELDYIVAQNTTHNKRSLLDAYQFVWALLNTSLNDVYIDTFKKLFKFVVEPEETVLYEDEDC